jgi:hypothetical protein
MYINLERTGEEVVMASYKIARNVPGGTEENCKRLSQDMWCTG